MSKQNPFQSFLLVTAAASCLLMSACSKTGGPKITGKREAIFLDDDPVLPDPELAGTDVILPSATSSSSWPTASGSVNHAKDAVRVKSPLQKAWSVDVGSGSGRSERLLNGPVAGNGMVYSIDTRGRIFATRTDSGKTVWTTNATKGQSVAQAFSGGLALEGQNLFAVTPTAELVMIDAKTGAIQKRFSLSAPVRSAPTVHNGSVYVVNINNQLEVINYEAGRTVWSHTGIMEVAGLLGGASPALDEDIIVVPYTSGEVYALHPQTGVPLWRQSLVSLTKLDPVSSLFHIKARPIVKNNRVYLIGNGGMMMCLDASSGQTIWKHPVGGIRSPAVSGDYLFMISNLNELLCMNRHTGGIVWVRQLPRYDDESKRTKPVIWAGPILVNQSLVVSGSNGEAHVISTKDGKDQQVLDIGANTLLSPIAVDGKVIFMTDKAQLVAFE